MRVYLNKKAFQLFFFFFTVGVFSCENIQEAEQSATLEVSDTQFESMSKGFQLLETNCFSCHSPDAGFKNRVAPPMIAIKKHYIDKGTSQEKFTHDLIEFIINPSEEVSKMPGAVEKFGLMPKMNFSDSAIIAIAHYIYHTELESPGWFSKHYKNERKKYMNTGMGLDKSYLERGQEYAMATKGILGKNLLSSIKSKGSDGAVEFCNENAYALTDSMSSELNVKIKRVSDQPRNPNNIANDDELNYIKKFKNNSSKGNETGPEIKEMDGKMVGYYPIITNQMCMQCHGQPETDISIKTLKKIDHLYPSDKARGYDVDELRGIWVVEMEKQLKK